ncbi:MAG: GNAT family N-acetyltransferase [Cyanobacteria bacterium P01_C01_bin.69]
MTQHNRTIIRSLALDDEAVLWEMLYQALYVPQGNAELPREIVQLPEIARYVQNWGREGDGGFLASEARTGQAIGAVWLRLLTGKHKSYGYVDDDIPELSMAVLPDYRGQGVGTQLLTHLLLSDYGQRPMSLSVSANNPAMRLYERFGFEIVSMHDESLTMRRD